MNEHNEFQSDAADQRLDKHLLALQHFAPREGFDNRVLARLRQPAPALVRFRTRALSLATPGRLWWASGLAAASSVAWMVPLVQWFTTGPGMPAMNAWLMSQLVQPAWAAILHGATVAAQAAVWYALAAYGALGNALFGMLVVAMFLPVLSSWGLYFTLKTNRAKRIAAYAAR